MIDRFESWTFGVRDVFDGVEGVWVGLSAVLAIVAVAILVQTYARHRGADLRLRESLGRSVAALWLLPVIAVALLVLARAGTTLAPRPEPPNDRAAPMTDAVSRSNELLASVDLLPEPAPMPGWIHEGRVDGPTATLVTISSRQFATTDEAERDAITMAMDVLADDVERHEPRLDVRGPLPTDLVRDAAVRRQYVETIERSTENADFTVHRVHLQVELSDRVRRQVMPYWTSRVAEERLAVLAALAGFLTLSFGTLAGYLRLDDLTKGRLRGRLRFAAAALVTAGGLFAATIV